MYAAAAVEAELAGPNLLMYCLAEEQYTMVVSTIEHRWIPPFGVPAGGGQLRPRSLAYCLACERYAAIPTCIGGY
jgi:hypothetical protein